jgi:hypothetical protein
MQVRVSMRLAIRMAGVGAGCSEYVNIENSEHIALRLSSTPILQKWRPNLSL